MLAIPAGVYDYCSLFGVLFDFVFPQSQMLKPTVSFFSTESSSVLWNTAQTISAADHLKQLKHRENIWFQLQFRSTLLKHIL